MIQIRPYTLNDWDGICKVHDRSRPLELSDTPDGRSFTPLKEDPEGTALQQCRLLVACEGDRIVGFSGSHETYLGWLYMDPDYSGLHARQQVVDGESPGYHRVPSQEN